MFYDYICEEEHITEITMSPLKDIPKEVVCDTCGKPAKRIYSSRIVIPENFKATSDLFYGDNYANLDNLKSKFKHSHPSGREDKIFY